MSSRRLLVGLALAVALAGASGTSASSASSAASVAAKPNAAVPHLSPAGRIKHVVVIYQENHSFDETLGRYCQIHAGRCDGYVGPVRLSNRTVAKMTVSSDVVPNVAHDVKSQATAINGGTMDGWHRVNGCSAAGGYQCLTYYAPNQIPSLAALADHYVISDRTFSMSDSPSWGGHVYVAAATQNNFTGELPQPVKGITPGPGWGCDSKQVTSWINPVTKKRLLVPSCIPARAGTLPASQYPYNGAFRPTPVKWVPTIFDRLDAKNRSWKLYSSTLVWSICPSFAECEFGPQHFNVVPPMQFITDTQHNQLPAYSVLLPSGPAGTSQHNAASMLAGDNWIGQVINTLQHSPEWSSTAVFITYDDCGCFYDHVAPGVNPDGTTQGIRMPTVIVSPYAKVAYTDSHPATFASILRFTEEAFGLTSLGINDLNAYDYANSFNFASPPTAARAKLTQHPVSAAVRKYIAAHPGDLDDPT